MKINKARLQEIILQEYLKEEGILLELTDEEKEEMLAWIKGGARPKWATKDLGTSGAGKAMQSPMDPSVDRSADTMPFPADDIPSDDAPESEYSGFQDRTGMSLEDQIAALVQGMPPEEVSDLFQAVFAKIPGVEIIKPEPDDKPSTEYVRGAGGRPKISSFGLDEIKELVREVLTDEMY